MTWRCWMKMFLVQITNVFQFLSKSSKGGVHFRSPIHTPQKINKPNYLVGGSNPQPLGPEVRRPTDSTMLVVPYLPNPSPLGWPLSVTLSLYACTCLNLVWSSDSRNHYDNWLSGRHFRVFVTAAPKKKNPLNPWFINKQYEHRMAISKPWSSQSDTPKWIAQNLYTKN